MRTPRLETTPWNNGAGGMAGVFVPFFFCVSSPPIGPYFLLDPCRQGRSPTAPSRSIPGCPSAALRPWPPRTVPPWSGPCSPRPRSNPAAGKEGFGQEGPWVQSPPAAATGRPLRPPRSGPASSRISRRGGRPNAQAAAVQGPRIPDRRLHLASGSLLPHRKAPYIGGAPRPAARSTF